MSSEPTRAVYVRLSERLAKKLDRAAARLGMTKRDVVSGLLNDHLDVDGDDLVVNVGRRLQPEDPPAASSPGPVLTLDETAELLRTAPDAVLSLIEGEGLPARRVGSQWRLARTAVLDWLARREDGSGSDG